VPRDAFVQRVLNLSVGLRRARVSKTLNFFSIWDFIRLSIWVLKFNEFFVHLLISEVNAKNRRAEIYFFYQLFKKYSVDRALSLAVTG
jgi:hypothetical protein